ncbi:MAG: hypothetical protein Q9160_001819 [Pyrenula sp. 1 TL-2023]
MTVHDSGYHGHLVFLLTRLHYITHYVATAERKHKQFDTKDVSVSRKQVGLIALLYSLLLQIIHLLSTEFVLPDSITATDTDATTPTDNPAPTDASTNSLKDQFNLLDGTPSSIPTALSLLDRLLTLTGLSSSLICIIDGLQLIDDPNSTTDHITHLLGILRREPSSPEQQPQQPPAPKVLFTTNGASLTLIGCKMRARERVNITGEESLNRPGTGPLKGGRDIAELGFGGGRIGSSGF